MEDAGCPSARAGKSLSWVLGLTGLAAVPAFLLLVIGMRLFIFEAFEMTGPSMSPTYVPGDRVVVSRLNTPTLGDPVVLNRPGDGVTILKRIVGVGGDRIAIRDGVLVRNGQPVPQRQLSRPEPLVCLEEHLGDARYGVERETLAPRSDRPEIVVPEDHFYVLGDRRDRSVDSRGFGPVPVDAFEGKIVATYWESDETSPCAR
jgi:signal peptidase I